MGAVWRRQLGFSGFDPVISGAVGPTIAYVQRDSPGPVAGTR
jgi:hypothetical protein